MTVPDNLGIPPLAGTGKVGKRHRDRSLQIEERALALVYSSAAERTPAAGEVWDRHLALIDAWAEEHADDEPWWDRFVADGRAARAG